MTEDRPSHVLGGLPRTRPHRRSEKRAARPADSADLADLAAKLAVQGDSAGPPHQPRVKPAKSKPLRQPAQPAGAPSNVGAAGRKPSKDKAGAGQAKRAAASRPAASRPRASTRGSAPARPPAAPPEPSTSVLGTAVQAAAELAEIGLSLSAQTVRGVIARLPRP